MAAKVRKFILTKFLLSFPTSDNHFPSGEDGYLNLL